MASDEGNLPRDPVPIAGAGELARFSHAEPKPPREGMINEESQIANWQALATSSEFRRLLKAKRRFVVPAMIFFIGYYFALPVLVGYARPMMEKRVLGAVNLAYLFALSQFFMAWIIAALYVRAATKFDKMADDVISQNVNAHRQS